MRRPSGHPYTTDSIRFAYAVSTVFAIQFDATASRFPGNPLTRATADKRMQLWDAHTGQAILSLRGAPLLEPIAVGCVKRTRADTPL